ncbi:helix-turn-helix domain-containing protein [Paraburkholderia strydomiana]|uniref:helix-turn-helix domain-containing protein n=1 Tax=Paraburkholderia strydomiana TaxID=1245417 RepID=UPI0038BC54E7
MAWYKNAFTESFKLPYAIVPLPVVLDTRLSDQDRRVLIAVIAHAKSASGSVFGLSQERISEISRVNKTDVSRAVNRLMRYGWLSIRRRHNAPSDYTVHIPDILFNTPQDRRMPDEQWAEVKGQRELAAVEAHFGTSFDKFLENGFGEVSPADDDKFEQMKALRKRKVKYLREVREVAERKFDSEFGFEGCPQIQQCVNLATIK